MPKSILSVNDIMKLTDYIGKMYLAVQAPVTALSALSQGYIDLIYGTDGSDGNPVAASLGESNAIGMIGQQAIQLRDKLNNSSVESFFLGGQVGVISNYLKRYVPNAPNLPNTVVDITSYIRWANGCPDPSVAGQGKGSNYSHLLDPNYARFIHDYKNGVNPLPPDVVFAPTGVVLGTYDIALDHFTSGLSLMSAASASYAPTNNFTSATPVSVPPSPPPVLPNGSAFVTLTGLNQSGVSRTWRGDIATGLTAANQILAVGRFQGASGGSLGGNASAVDLLASVISISRDTTVSNGGTATQGIVNVVTYKLR